MTIPVEQAIPDRLVLTRACFRFTCHPCSNYFDVALSGLSFNIRLLFTGLHPALAYYALSGLAEDGTDSGIRSYNKKL